MNHLQVKTIVRGATEFVYASGNCQLLRIGEFLNPDALLPHSEHVFSTSDFEQLTEVIKACTSAVPTPRTPARK